MLYRDISKLLGIYFFAFALMILVPLGFSIYYENFLPEEAAHYPSTVVAFIYTLLTCLLVASLLLLFGRKAKATLYRREGLLAVVLIWFLSPAIASMPFIYSGTIKNPFQAYFEGTSGLTTTGATTLTPKKYDETGKEIPHRKIVRGELDAKYVFYGNVEAIRDKEGRIIYEGIEAVSKPILFWRSYLQWIGGLGIIVLFVAILPALGVGGKFLFHTEMPGPIKESLTPRIKETAAFLWKIYLGFSVAIMILLKTTNPAMNWFEVVTTMFSTVSTGGFSVHNASIGYYQNAATEWIVALFMTLGGVNFSLYFFCVKGKFYRLYDRELFLYFIIIIIASLYIGWNIMGTEKFALTGEASGAIYSVSEAIRTGFFQVISASTSSGFVTANYDKWPFVTQVLLLILIYLGGMSGSTAGGMKTMRYYMLFRIVQAKIELIFRPETIRTFRIGNIQVDQGVIITVLCYFVTLIFFAVIGVSLLTLNGLDPETALGTTSSVINNSGLGFRQAGPTDSYGFLPNFSLAVGSLWMLLGRLEFFAVLIIFVPSFWKTNA